MIGPIFDAYGPAYVIIPGSIGITAALICFSFSESMYYNIASSHDTTLLNLFLISKTDKTRILSDISIIQHFRRSLVVYSIHASCLLHRSLVSHSPWLCNRHRLHRRWSGRCIIPDNNLICSPQDRFSIGNPHYRIFKCYLVHPSMFVFEN